MSKAFMRPAQVRGRIRQGDKKKEGSVSPGGHGGQQEQGHR